MRLNPQCAIAKLAIEPQCLVERARAFDPRVTMQIVEALQIVGARLVGRRRDGIGRVTCRGAQRHRALENLLRHPADGRAVAVRVFLRHGLRRERHRGQYDKSNVVEYDGA